MISRVTCAFVLFALCACSREKRADRAAATPDEQAACLQYDLPDSVVSPTGVREIRLASADAGLESLQVVDRQSRTRLFSLRDDIVNVRWLPDSRGFVYAAGPIYAPPGIFLVELATGAKRRLVGPTNTADSAYRDGADLFVICDARAEAGGTRLTYLQFPHIDSVDLRVRPLRGPVHELTF